MKETKEINNSDDIDRIVGVLVAKLEAISDLPLDVKDRAGFRMKHHLVSRAISDAREQLTKHITESDFYKEEIYASTER